MLLLIDETRKISSAYTSALIPEPPSSYPTSRGDNISTTLATKQKNGKKRESPCLTPLVTLTGFEQKPCSSRSVEIFQYRNNSLMIRTVECSDIIKRPDMSFLKILPCIIQQSDHCCDILSTVTDHASLSEIDRICLTQALGKNLMQMPNNDRGYTDWSKTGRCYAHLLLGPENCSADQQFRMEYTYCENYVEKPSRFYP